LVELIHVLGEKHLALTAHFERGQCLVRVVRDGLSEPTPADHAARRVSPGPVEPRRQPPFGAAHGPSNDTLARF
jgi:hypothetical protein